MEQLRQCRQGVAYIEFAVTVSFLILVLIGTVELTRYILLIQKVEKTVDSVTDVVTQYDPTTDPLTAAGLQPILNDTPFLMSPYSFGANGYIILTDVSQTAGKAVVNWQYCGGGTFKQPSRVGKMTTNPATPPIGYPNGFTISDGEEVVIGEIFYAYSPVFNQSFVSPTIVYRAAILQPRSGSLALPGDLDPANYPPTGVPPANYAAYTNSCP
jgi:Flp pilus assembly protein TadG